MKFVAHFHHGNRRSFPENVLGGLEKSLVQVNPKWTRNEAPESRAALLSQLQAEGWSDRIKVKGNTKLTIAGILSDTGLCVQFGNVARLYADLLKLQLAYNENVIARAVFVVPCKESARSWGSNLAYFERLKEELDLFAPIVTVPIAVYGLSE